MPTPPLRRAVRAPQRPSLRRLRHLLALAAVALPLLAATAAPAGAPAGALGAAPSGPDATPRAVQVVVVDGLHVRIGLADAPDVAGALAALGVTPGPFDRVDPAPDVPLDGPTTVRLARVTVEEERRSIELPVAVVRVDDPGLLRGLVEVVEEGRAGLHEATDLVLRVDGRVTSRLRLTSTRIREPVARIERVGTGERPTDTVWDALARCESSGRWDAVRTVGDEVAYRGGLQFAATTWDAFRPSDFPAHASDATREQQILVAERVLARQGWGAWPACAARLGLR